MRLRAGLAFTRQLRDEPLLFLTREERRVGGPAGQEIQNEHAANDRWQSFEHEQPSPAVDAEPVNVIEDQSRDRGAEDVRHRLRADEERHRLGLFPLAEPIGQVQQHSGKESGFGEPEEKSCHDELLDVLHEPRADGDDAPRDQDARDPDTRADPVEHEVAWNLEDEIPEEEDPDSKAVLRARDPEILVHRQCREPDIDPIQESDDVQEKDEREDVEANLADGRGRETGFRTIGDGRHPRDMSLPHSYPTGE